jgi:hypothetical protein
MLAVVTAVTMPGRAMSEDDADQLKRHQLPVFEKAAP